MRRLAGQAGLMVNRAIRVLAAGLVLAGLGIAALAWRLEQGPLAVPWLARQIERVLTAEGGTRLLVGEATIAWAGWREGHRSPLEFSLRRIQAVGADGGVLAALPDAALSLSLPWLLRGVIAPRAIELRGLELRASRTAAGDFALDLGSLATGGEAGGGDEAGEAALAALAEFMRPPSQETPLAALRRLRLNEGRLRVEDAQLGLIWVADIDSLYLTRREGGGLDLAGQGALTLGPERVPLRIGGALDGASLSGDLTLGLPAIRPAALARAAPVLAPLAALDAPAALTLDVRLDGLRIPSVAQARLRAGQGTIEFGAHGRLAIDTLLAEASLAEGVVRVDSLVLRPSPPARPAGPAPTVTASAEARQTAAGWRAEARLRLDEVALPDLAHYWPEGMARNARRWIAENIPAGVVRDGQWRIVLAGDAAAGRIGIESFEGSARGEGAEVHWLRPVPPAEGARATARFAREAIEIDIGGGRQSGTGIAIREGRIRFGLDSDPETAEMEFRLDGPLPEVWTLLRHPRLGLFARRPPPVPSIFGTLREARLQVGFPMVADLPIELVRISASGRGTEVRVPRALLGRDLERGSFEFTADTEGLRVSGNAMLAGIPLRIQQEADFRPGTPGQVVARETVTGRAEARLFAGLGLDPRPFVEGPVGIEVRSETRRNGQGRALLRTDLTAARLAVDALAWAKPPGVTAAGEAMLVLQNGALQRIEGIRITAPDALVRASAGEVRESVPRRIEIQPDSRLGRSRMGGEILPPQPRAQGWQVALRGPVLDLAPVLAAPPERPADASDQPGPPVSIEARFERMLLREDRALTGVTASARVSGTGVVQAAQVRGQVAGGGAFEMGIAAEGQRRRLRITSEDGGGLLRAFGVLRTVQGGRLVVDAVYPHSRPGAPLTGTAELDDFAVRDAPGLAKLLQAMTVYGVFEALAGQDLTFARLIAPFTLTHEALVLDDARAFSVSLGLTARGRIDRLRDTIDMEGTIVPAYVFNSLLGRIPVLGRIFSPEPGGGLFAATYRMRGPLADPSIAVNPLAALTPGFLRGVFGLGQDGAPTEVPPRR